MLKASVKQPTVVRSGQTDPLRKRLLNTAVTLTCGDRDVDYGDPHDQADRASRIFNAWTGRDLTASEVTMMMIAVKMSRLPSSPTKADHYADLMAYTGILAECIEAETEQDVS